MKNVRRPSPAMLGAPTSRHVRPGLASAALLALLALLALAGCGGDAGTDGMDGMASLLATVAEPADLHCPSGGTKVTSGIDTNGNHVLDASEVTSTSYVCNGASGSTSTVDVTTTSVQAISNTTYLADSASMVTVTLPASPAVGDVVVVSGVGSGGWTIAQGAGQRVYTGFADSAWATPDTPIPQALGFALSGSGQVRVVGGYYTDLYTSVDGGVTWTDAPTPGQLPWQNIVVSRDGSHILATGYNAPVWLSTDSGATWQATPLQGDNWAGFAMSSDGTHMTGAIYNGMLWESADGGQTWAVNTSAGQKTWSGIAMSADGMRQVATEQSGNGSVWLSTDAGVTWTPSSAPTQSYNAVASAADGLHLLAASQSLLYTSADGGATWTPRATPGQWYNVASSDDGRFLATYDNEGESAEVYVSTDFGATWHTQGAAAQQWRGIQISGDGSQLFVEDDSATVLTARSATTTGTAGFLSGGQYETVTLQYAGGGVFAVTAEQGTPSAH